MNETANIKKRKKSQPANMAQHVDDNFSQQTSKVVLKRQRKDFDDNREPAAAKKRKLAKIGPPTNAHGRERQHVMVPVGLKWKENSCAFDATLTILYNIWQMNSDL